MNLNRFRDRAEAGKLLAKAMKRFSGTNSIVLALPRGGVPVAYEIAQELDLPLDLVVVRKLGVPGHEELAMGAIAEGGGKFVNQEIVRYMGIDQNKLEAADHAEQLELERRQRLYREGRPLPSFEGKTVILVDDGIATGATLRAAIASVQKLHPLRLVVAVPVAPPETVGELRQGVDEVICLLEPENLEAVGLWYEHFSQTSDQEVLELLRKSKKLT